MLLSRTRLRSDSTTFLLRFEQSVQLRFYCFVIVSRFWKIFHRLKSSLKMSGLFHGPLSECTHSHLSAQVKLPPRNSGILPKRKTLTKMITQMKLENIRLHALVHLKMRLNLPKTFLLLTTKAYARLIRAIVLD